jgi:glutamate synthase domain-containing protein 3
MATKAKEDERTFILECIEVYHSLPALWNVKSKDYSNRIKKKEKYEQLLRKYGERFPDADKNQLLKKFNSLRTNFRKELKRIKDSERSGTGADDVVEPALWYFEEMKFVMGQEEAWEQLQK